MGATRKITYAAVGDPSPVVVYSSAETWGELKSEFPDMCIKAIGKSAWAKTLTMGDTGYGLSSDSTRLQEGDINLYFLINKNDSGTK